MKVSFKKEKPETGLAAVGSPYPNTQIKGDKLVVGFIYAPTWHSKDDKWSLSFALKNEENACQFGWVKLKARFDTEKEARDFVKKHWGLIEEKYDLFQFEKDMFEE